MFVVGGGLLALGIARAMRRTGVPVVVFTATAESLLPYSRRCRLVSVAPGDDDALLRAVFTEAASCSTPPVLIPAGDKALLFSCSHTDQLGECVRVVLPSLDAASTVLEKDRFDTYAQKHGVPVPQSWAFADLDELRQEAGHLPYPLAVKPSVSTHWHGTAFTSAFGHIKMLRVDTPAELVACVERIAALAPMPLVQEFVVGGDHEHYSYVSYRNREGVELSGVLVQKLRLSPIRYGLGTCARVVRNQDMEAIGRHVTATLPYRSVASVCFKRDVRTGAPKVFEVNGRLPLNFPAIGVAGMNLPLLMYRDALGDSPSPATVKRYGRLWTTLSHDIWAMRGYQRAGELSFAQWLWSYREVKQVLELDWRDPGPGIALGATVLERKFRRAN